MSEARTLNHKAVDSAIKADNKENGAVYLANAAVQEAAYGFMQLARQSAAAALKLAPASPGATVESALALAMAGDTAQAESLVADINRRYPVDARMQQVWLPAIRSQLALGRKNPADALDSMQPDSSIQYGLIDFVNNISCLYPTYIRGQAYLAGGKDNPRPESFKRFSTTAGWCGLLDRSTGALGGSARQCIGGEKSGGCGRGCCKGGALAAYKTFLELWKDAEPGIPIYKEAKVEYARLLNP